MQVPRKTQWWMIGGGYAAITAYAVVLLYSRHQAMLQDPTIASSGMYAFGDALTVLFLCFLYLIPTIFSLRLFADNAGGYEKVTWAALVIAATAPIALLVVIMKAHTLDGFAQLRLLGWPVVLAALGVVRWFAKSKSTKRAANLAIVVEVIPLLVLMTIFFP